MDIKDITNILCGAEQEQTPIFELGCPPDASESLFDSFKEFHIFFLKFHKLELDSILNSILSISK